MKPDLASCLAQSNVAGVPTVLLQDGARWLLFREPAATLATRRLGDVAGILEEVEAAVAQGRWAAGFLSYEAAPAFDRALVARQPGEEPLVWWGLFDPPRELDLAAGDSRAAGRLDWRPTVSHGHYRAALERIRAHIAAGDTYQVNYTFALEARLFAEPEAFFAALVAAQRCRYAAYLDLGRFAVCSASPELFFELDGRQITTRPMKGTARRGRYPEEDDRRAAALLASLKDRAENVMVVDMMRNDLGKISEPGTVRADKLFAVETYPTLHQLTSTVSATTVAGVTEILRALFPCASITGAPKVSTCGIIRRLETAPRGVYTGAIGFIAPGRRARFNVAIRTAVFDRERGTARYGTGGGIVWDSAPDSEWEECRTKSLVLAPRDDFSLLETLLWRRRSGYFLLDRHLGRLAASARYFAVPVRTGEVRSRLLAAADGFSGDRGRVRLLVDQEGGITVETAPYPGAGNQPWRVTLDDRPVDADAPNLFHKTTRREVYDEARQRHPETDDVVLWNARGELTESTVANLVLKLDGESLTPHLDCGLLAGTYRAELIERGRIREEVLPVAAFAAAQEVFLINSVRGWIRVQRVVSESG